jgi:A/G-specific adenine glycosylase
MKRAAKPVASVGKLSPQKRQASVGALLGWFAQNARDLPWRRTLDPYAIWISELMLQQTQVKTVVPYWERWLRELPDVPTLATARPEKVLKLWEGLGYYTRARNLQKAAQHIVAQHGGKFPADFAGLLSLPGIGRYTAGAISSIAFNHPNPILDGNVIRVLTRLFGLRDNPREKAANARLWDLAGQLVTTAAKVPLPTLPDHLRALSGSCSALNQSLMELGATLCTPRQPSCLACPLSAKCVARRKGLTGELPNLGERARTTAREFIALVVEHRSKFLVRQRPAGIVNAHLWEFPNIEVDSITATPAAAARSLGFALASPKPICVVNHSITRYRISLKAFRARGAAVGGVAKLNGRWCSLNELDALAFTSAHRKILRHLVGCAATKG